MAESVAESVADPVADPAPADLSAPLRDWIFGLALPLWRHHPGCESLGLDGRPREPGFRRMRVQARQLYVFSEAARRGVAGAEAIARDIHRFMGARGARSDGGWARRLRPDGTVLDPACDLYDLAFVLFGLAHYGRVTGDQEPRRQADRTLAFLRRVMAHPAGGFVGVWPPEPGWRQQNPHMHLLEAALAQLEAGGDARWAELAAELVALFRDRFLEPETGTLGEYFAEDWHRAAGIDGDKVEPGHQAEWIWLLDRHHALTGEDTATLVRTLDHGCLAHGIGPQTGLVRDEVGRDGSLRLGSARLWPQTEMLKAQCVMHRSDGDRAVLIGRILGNLLGRYLVGPEGGVLPPGTWIDQLDAFGRPAIQAVPTSSLYHVMSTWVELDRLHRPGGDVPVVPVVPVGPPPTPPPRPPIAPGSGRRCP